MRDKEWYKTHVLLYVKENNIDYMPTTSEIGAYFGTGFGNICRTGVKWAELANGLGLKIKDSETTFGKQWEKFVFDLLSSLGYKVEPMSQNFSYDLLVNENVKIDVKASKLYHSRNGYYYSFNLETNRPRCDIYILLCIDEKSECEKLYIIPSVFVSTNSHISIGYIKSKYDKFIDEFDYIKTYSDFFNSILTELN